jgi:hypothetical protein
VQTASKAKTETYAYHLIACFLLAKAPDPGFQHFKSAALIALQARFLQTDQ